nr:MAG TPA: hypothetical protein [Caudoviricetes sp.]
MAPFLMPRTWRLKGSPAPQHALKKADSNTGENQI